MTKFDDALSLVGGFGPSQYWLSFCSVIIQAYCGWPSIISVFVALQVPFQCLDKGYPSDPQNIVDSKNATDNMAIGPDNMVQTPHEFNSKCEKECLHYIYKSSPSSIISTFDLACGSGPTLVSFANSSFWVAFLLSCFLVGPLSDKYGRRRIFLPFAVCYFFVTLTLAFVQDIYQFIIVRFFCGIFHSPTMTISYIITMEMISQGKRSIVGMIACCSFSVGAVVSSLVALHFENSWRNQIITMALVQLPILIVSYFKLCESGRWLLQKGEYDKLEKLLLKTAKNNGKKITLVEIKECIKYATSDGKENKENEREKLLPRLGEEDESEKNGADTTLNFFDLFKTFKSSFLCITNMILWLAVAQIYYGLNFGVDILPGNVYLNAILLSFVEYPAVFSIVAIERFGRKPSLILIFIISSVACLALPFTNKHSGHSALPLILAMLGKLVMCSAFGIIYFYTPEQMPTTLRTTGISACSAVARIGTITAPFVIQLNYFSPYAPYCVFATTGFVACLLCVLFSVETRGKTLPQSLSDFYNLVHGKTTQN